MTSGGHLYIFNEDRKLSKWMDIQVTRSFSFSIDYNQKILLFGCADGIIRLFSAETLEHVMTN